MRIIKLRIKMTKQKVNYLGATTVKLLELGRILQLAVRIFFGEFVFFKVGMFIFWVIRKVYSN